MTLDEVFDTQWLRRSTWLPPEIEVGDTRHRLAVDTDQDGPGDERRSCGGGRTTRSQTGDQKPAIDVDATTLTHRSGEFLHGNTEGQESRRTASLTPHRFRDDADATLLTRTQHSQLNRNSRNKLGETALNRRHIDRLQGIERQAIEGQQAVARFQSGACRRPDGVDGMDQHTADFAAATQ